MIFVELTCFAFLFIFIDLLCHKTYSFLRVPSASVGVCFDKAPAKISVACDSHEVVQAVGFGGMFLEMRPVDVDNLKMIVSVFKIEKEISEVCVSM